MLDIEQNKRRLIIVDLDGTALTDEAKIHPLTLKALLAAQAKGHIICIVTGRPWRASQIFYNQLKLKTLIANLDGSLIHHPLENDYSPLIFTISERNTLKILNEPVIKKYSLSCILERPNCSMAKAPTEYLKAYFHTDTNSTRIVDNISTEWNGEANNITFAFDSKEVDENKIYTSFVKYNKTARINVREHTKKGDLIFSLTNRWINKARAAELLAQYYNIDLNDAIGFGDEFNDLEMIQQIGYGIAMQNACSALKTVADDITHKTNNEGGLGDYLIKLLNLPVK